METHITYVIVTCRVFTVPRNVDSYTQAWKQISGDPSGLKQKALFNCK